MVSHTQEKQIHKILMPLVLWEQFVKTKHPISPLYIRTYVILITAHDESDGDERWDGRLVVSPPGRIQAVWDRSNLTQPSFIDTGHVRLDLSHIANIIPL